MRQISLREFRTRGAKALGHWKREPVLLTGQKGPAYFLVPVIGGDPATQGAELERAVAKASLAETQRAAREAGLSDLTEKEVEVWVGQMRGHPKPQKR